MNINYIRKKHNIPSSEEIIHIKIEDKECFLRQPTINDMDMITPLMDKPYTSIKKILELLFLDGDKEFLTDKKLIKSLRSLKDKLYPEYISTIKIEDDLQYGSRYIITTEIDENNKKEIILREPSLEEEENMLMLMIERPISTLRLAFQSLYISGDKEYENDVNLLLASIEFLSGFFNEKEALIEKK